MQTDKIKSPTLHFLIIWMVAAFLSIIAVSIVFEIEIVAQGKGRVVPQSRVQVVQPEFTGQIVAIEVRNGMQVSKGDVLIRLNDTDPRTDVKNLKQEKFQLLIEAARITALSRSISNFGSDKHDISEIALGDFANRASDFSSNPFFQEQLDLLGSEIRNLQSELAQMDARMLVNNRSQARTIANIQRTKTSIQTQKERLEARKVLLANGNISRISYLDTVDAYNEEQKHLDLAELELAQKKADDKVIIMGRENLLTSERRRLLSRGSEISSSLTILNNELAAAERRLHGMIIRSPVDGVVDSMEVFTIGGLANGGDEIMRIVPANDRPEIEAIFSNSDIGFLESGQVANIKLDAFPSARFGYVEGKVADVSADAREVEDKNWGFVVRVIPDEPVLATPLSTHALQPGMTASIDIITGKRRLISFFFAPIVEVIESSLGER